MFIEERNKKYADAQRKLMEIEVFKDTLQKEHQTFDSE
jgi:hypothetical protein